MPLPRKLLAIPLAEYLVSPTIVGGTLTHQLGSAPGADAARSYSPGTERLRERLVSSLLETDYPTPISALLHARGLYRYSRLS